MLLARIVTSKASVAEPGNLQIALAGAAPDQLAGDIARSSASGQANAGLFHYPNLVAGDAQRTSA